MPQSVIALGLLLGTLLVGVFFAYIFSLKRQNYLLFWTAAWALYALHYLCPALSPWIRLLIEISGGAAAYIATVMLLHRDRATHFLGIAMRSRKPKVAEVVVAGS